MKILLIAGKDQHASQFRRQYEHDGHEVTHVETRDEARKLIDEGNVYGLVCIGGAEIAFGDVGESALYYEPSGLVPRPTTRRRRAA